MEPPLRGGAKKVAKGVGRGVVDVPVAALYSKYTAVRKLLVRTPLWRIHIFGFYYHEMLSKFAIFASPREELRKINLITTLFIFHVHPFDSNFYIVDVSSFQIWPRTAAPVQLRQ